MNENVEENLNSAAIIKMLPIAAIKFDVAMNKERPVGVLFQNKHTGQYRVMDVWGRFCSSPSPEEMLKQEQRISDLEQSLTEVLGLVPLPPINEGTPWQVRKARALLGCDRNKETAR